MQEWILYLEESFENYSDVNLEWESRVVQVNNHQVEDQPFDG